MVGFTRPAMSGVAREEMSVAPQIMGKEGSAMEQLMYRPAEAASVLGMGRTAVFGLLKSGRLRSVKLGGARFITADALRAFVRELEKESSNHAGAETA